MLPMNSQSLPGVIADGPLAAAVVELLQGHVRLLPWSILEHGSPESVRGIYTYGHPELTGPMLDRFPDLSVISNYGVASITLI